MSPSEPDRFTHASSSSHQQPPIVINLAHLPALTQATSGAIGSVVSNALVYPLDLVTTRMQTRSLRTKTKARTDMRRQSSLMSEASVSSTNSAIRTAKNYKSLLSSFQTIVTTESNGFRAFYNGILVDSSATLIGSFLYFFVYTTLNKAAAAYKKRLQRNIGALEATVEELVVGALAGMMAKFCTCPLSNITVRLQTSRPARRGIALATPGFTPYPEKHESLRPLLLSKSSEVQDPNSSSEDDSDEENEPSRSYISHLLETIRAIYDERGYLGFWSGFGNNCILTLNPSLTLYLIKLLQHGQRSPSFMNTFLHSALASSLATVFTYPLMLSKTLIQVKGRSQKSLLSYRYRRFGLRALYTGLQAQLLKGFVGQGVTMSVKGQLEKLIVLIYLRRHPRKKESKT